MIVRVKVPENLKGRDAQAAAVALRKGPERRRHLVKLTGLLSTERDEGFEIVVEA